MSYSDYQKSVSQELISIKDRVRNFIGNLYWGDDGRYKENILRDIVKSKLPAFADCATGFVVGEHDQVSKQIDIIVYRNDIPLLFSKGDFVIVPEYAVLGIIEVKTKLTSSKVEDTLKNAHYNGMIINRNIFNGIFSYEDYSDNVSINRENILSQSLKNFSGKVNNIVLGKDMFLKYWEDGQPVTNKPERNKYRLYKIDDLAFGYFISNLIEDCYNIVKGEAVPETLRHFLYPIENTKEAYVAETLYV